MQERALPTEKKIENDMVSHLRVYLRDEKKQTLASGKKSTRFEVDNDMLSVGIETGLICS